MKSHAKSQKTNILNISEKMFSTFSSFYHFIVSFFKRSLNGSSRSLVQPPEWDFFLLWMLYHTDTHMYYTHARTPFSLFLFLCFLFSSFLFHFIWPSVALWSWRVGSSWIFSLCLPDHSPLQTSQEELRVAGQPVRPKVSQSLERKRPLPLNVTWKHQRRAGPTPNIQHRGREEHRGVGL